MKLNFTKPDPKLREMIENATNPARAAIEKWGRERDRVIAGAFKEKFGTSPYQTDAFKDIKCFNIQTGENTWTEYYTFATRCFLKLEYGQSYVFDYKKKTFTSDIEMEAVIPEKLTIYMGENGKLIFDTEI